MKILPDTTKSDLPLSTMIERKHVMLLYDSLEHYRCTACRYIRDGLEHNERCVMATDQYPHCMIKKDFSLQGFDIDPYVQKGQLILANVRDSYNQDTGFDPNETIKKWQTMTDQACADGYNRLRTVGEAIFVSDKPELNKELIYYENIINQELFPFYPFLSICVYAKELYPPEVIKAAIKAHPMLIYNDVLFNTNIYYVPPEIYFRENSQEKEIDRWLANMAATNASAQALAQSEEKFRTIFNNANDGFFIHALDEDNRPGLFLEVNDAALRALGYSRDELLHLSPLDLIANDYSELKNIIEDLLTKGHATFERLFYAKDGVTHPVEISSYLFTFKDSPTVFSVARDLSSRKQAEEQEKHLQEQLRQLQKTEALGTLTGGIAHDFNNILAIIMGYTELAQRQLPKETPVQTSLREIHSGCLRARDIIRQLLTFARKETPQKKMLDIRPVIKEGLKMLRSTLPSGIRFDIDIPQGAFPLIKADLTQIHQILLNLCTNASHAMHNTSGVLSVRLQEVSLDPPEAVDLHLMPGPHVLLSVQDTGEGISPENRERIFEPYFTTKKTLEGTGLGLSVVQGIVTNHEGAIRCLSKKGEGTVFDIFFQAHPHKTSSAQHGEPYKSLPRGTETILLVDDEKSIVLLGEIRLTRLGYTVQSTQDPAQALTWFRSNPAKFDLVITDMNMPGMTGIALSRKLQAIDKDTPIILCSGFSSDMTGVSNPDSGITLYLDKPVDMSTWAISVRKVLDNSRKTHSA